MSSQTIKLTAKRQATFPAELCRDLDLHTGDRIALERRKIDGTPAWVIRPAFADELPSWFGVLRPFASGKTHDMDDIRRSIGGKATKAES